MSERSLNFVCIGPQRTATSWLHKYLVNHPQLRFPRQVKETKFFELFFENGMDWYWSHFDFSDDRRLTGEVAPTYFDVPVVLERLKVFPDLKVIVNVRNPIERTYSLFRLHRNFGDVSDNYFDAIEMMPRIESSGRYAEHCPRWEAAFGRDNCLYLVQEDIEAAPQMVIDQVCTFLKVDPLPLPEQANKRFGQTTRPKSRMMATIGTRVARVLRARRLHGVVEFAKYIGIRRLVLGDEPEAEMVPREIWERLSDLHDADIQFLEERLERSFQPWRNNTT